ncbi:hypothetical protein EUX98_g941 [Antrodiella citrinella]|uniref:protein-tyrosine-phosphatase n=1 Tax=Antrodiella citrinella TaxID=2447956 RepID=A0A4S4N577_9APHY|nr:hypothetical protein EUX98_g941 [Antrodiella citrinella]
MGRPLSSDSSSPSTSTSPPPPPSCSSLCTLSLSLSSETLPTSLPCTASIRASSLIHIAWFQHLHYFDLRQRFAMPAKKARPPTLALETSRKPVTTTVIEFQTPIDLRDPNGTDIDQDDESSLGPASSPSSSGSNSPLGYPLNADTDSDPNGDDISRDLAVLEQLRRSVQKNLRLRPLRSSSGSARPQHPSSSSDSPPLSSTPDSAISPESAYFTPLTEFRPLSAHPHTGDGLRRTSLDASSRLSQPSYQSPVTSAPPVGVSPGPLLSRLSAPTVPLLIDTRPVAAFLFSRLQRSVNMAIPSLILKRSKKPAGAFPSLDALRQFITTEEGLQTWDDLMAGDDWDGDVIVYDDVMEERDRNNSQATAWSLLNVLPPLLQHGSVDYLEGGLASARRHPYLSQLIVGSGVDEYGDPTREITIGSAPSSSKKAAGLSQLDTHSASGSGSKTLPEIEQAAPSPQPLMPSAMQSWNVIDDYSTPSPPPSSSSFSRPQPPRRPSIPALRRLDTASTERLKVPKLSVGPVLPAITTKPASLTAPTGLRSRSRSPSHLTLVSSNHSPPGSARLLSPGALYADFLPPPSPSYAQPSTPRTPGTPMPPSPQTARPDDQPLTTEDPHPAFTVSTILPNFLFLGPDITAEEHVQELLDLGVKRILNLAIECDDDHGLHLRERFERYVRIPMRDTVEEDNITRGVREACTTLDDARLHSAPTYVHCKAGKSRSVTAVMAYLIHANHWTLSRAYAFVVGRRKGISPNIGFVSELMTFEEQELGGKSVGVVKMTPTHDPSESHETDSGAVPGNATMGGNYQVAVGGRRPQHVRESLPPAFTSQHSFNLVPTIMDTATLGDSQQEMEIKDAEGRYRHARRAPVNEATLQPMRRKTIAFLRLFIFLAQAALAAANSVVDSDHELLGGWQDTSSDATANYLSDSISVTSELYGVFAVKNPAIALSSFSGVSFDIKGDHPYLYAFLPSTKNDLNSKGIVITNSINSASFIAVTVDFSSLPLAIEPWDTISFQTADEEVTYEVDNIILFVSYADWKRTQSPHSTVRFQSGFETKKITPRTSDSAQHQAEALLAMDHG